jgi:hypothetical protein
MVPGFFDLAPPAVFDTVPGYLSTVSLNPGVLGEPAALCKSASSGKP